MVGERRPEQVAARSAHPKAMSRRPELGLELGEKLAEIAPANLPPDLAIEALGADVAATALQIVLADGRG